jgi:DNA-binding NarL/FixJ family response regulator
MTRANRPLTSDDLAHLTPRERDVLQGLLQCRTYAEIANQLSISWHTVNSHVKAIYQKLHVCSRNELRERFSDPASDQTNR